MSNNTHTLNRAANAVANLEAALEETRKAHGGATVDIVEQKLAAFAEVVRNTYIKMPSRRPNPNPHFRWAFYGTLKVTSIDEKYINVQTTNADGSKRTVMIFRHELSLSTWQVTGLIRQQAKSHHLLDLKDKIMEKKKIVDAKHDSLAFAAKEADLAKARLQAAKEQAERHIARMEAVELKKAERRARRSTGKTTGKAADESTGKIEPERLATV